MCCTRPASGLFTVDWSQRCAIKRDASSSLASLVVVIMALWVVYRLTSCTLVYHKTLLVNSELTD